MHDLFGEAAEQWCAIENRIRSVLSHFGYKEIRTPVLEKVEVFSDTVGEDTDIVEKQMYTLLDQGAEKLALRPEGTASFMRAIIENRLHESAALQRYYYYLPMFRHERPQKGRLRQFYQFGAELINDASAEADAEIISLLHQIYQELEVVEYEVRINSVGCEECRPRFREELKQFLRPKLSLLCEQCQKRFERSVMRVLDCKKESCQAVLKGAPLITQFLCAQCEAHHHDLKKRLTQIQIRYLEDPHIVRGLDYYCRTAFEFTSELLGAQSALGAGGRYDGLSRRFGAKPFPAVGFALGMERLVMVLTEKGKLPSERKTPFYYFAALGPNAIDLLYPIALSLKKKGIWVEMNYDKSKSLKALLKQADRSGSSFTVLVGDDEIKESNAVLKNMNTSAQEILNLGDLEAALFKKGSPIAP